MQHAEETSDPPHLYLKQCYMPMHIETFRTSIVLETYSSLKTVNLAYPTRRVRMDYIPLSTPKDRRMSYE